MTEHATEFVGPTTFRALTHEKVAVGLFDDPEDPIHHVSLAQEADAFLIAPCTANVIAKIANGIADDLLTTTALATTAPLIIAPAMNVNMYDNGATRYNIGKLHIRGARIVEAGDGYLACGDVGKGRLADIEDIVSATLDELGVRRDLDGRRVMVTAGPTVEPIDPVRYISNRSSGKTGYAIARAAALRGADVTLVSGPVSLPAPEGVRVVRVRTAHEMLEAAEEAFRDADIAVFAAAVADMRRAPFPTASSRRASMATSSAPSSSSRTPISWPRSPRARTARWWWVRRRDERRGAQRRGEARREARRLRGGQPGGGGHGLRHRRQRRVVRGRRGGRGAAPHAQKPPRRRDTRQGRPVFEVTNPSARHSGQTEGG